MIIKKVFAQSDVLQAFRGDADFPTSDFIQQKKAHAFAIDVEWNPPDWPAYLPGQNKSCTFGKHLIEQLTVKEFRNRRRVILPANQCLFSRINHLHIIAVRER